MAKIIYGERIGKNSKLAVGTTCIIFDASRTKVLLTQRTDNGRWCFPGGFMEAGESVTEACQREVWEETGLHIRPVKLVGIYSNPDHITEYPDGNQFQIVTLCFEGEVLSGEPGISNETIAWGYFSLAEIEKMDFMEVLTERLQDAFSSQGVPFIR